jgi:hypothetical protein
LVFQIAPFLYFSTSILNDHLFGAKRLSATAVLLHYDLSATLRKWRLAKEDGQCWENIEHSDLLGNKLTLINRKKVAIMISF